MWSRGEASRVGENYENHENVRGMCARDAICFYARESFDEDQLYHCYRAPRGFNGVANTLYRIPLHSRIK